MKQVRNQKVLGITLDDNFTFQAHIEECAAKAKKSLAKISVLSNTLGGASAEILLLLFKSCVLPLLEYGHAVWCAAPKGYKQLEQVQQSALTMILGAKEHSSTSAMEVLANIMPLEIRLEIVLVSTFLRILRKPDNDNLKKKVMAMRIDPKTMAMLRSTPISQLSMAAYNLADFSLEHIEPYVFETMQDIKRPNKLETIIPTEQIGSSGKRTDEQRKLAQEVANSLLINAGNDTVIFTDGSAMPNPGPCGAGICAFWAGINGASNDTSIAVSPNSTSYHGELRAIDAALHMAAERQTTGTVHIFSDCQSAIRTAAADDIPRNFSALSQNIKSNAAKLGGNVKLTWVAGHANIGGNESADALAKEGAIKATTDPDIRSMTMVSCSEAKSRLKCNAVKKWKTRWKRQNTGRSYQEIIDPHRKLKRIHCRNIETKIHRLILQQTNLEEDKHKMYPEAYPTPACECGKDTGNVEHYLLHCSVYDTQRSEMVETIHAGYQKLNTDPNEQVYDVQTILGLNTSLDTEMLNIIANALSKYIASTKKSI